MQKFMDKVKEFCMKYKHYVGAAVVVVLIIVIIVAVNFAGDKDVPEDSQKGTEIQQHEPESQTPAAASPDGELQKNANEELVTLFNSYYTAYANADFESLEMVASPLTENEKSFILKFATYYEAYQNIVCYSVEAENGAYFVSVCYDLKFYDIDTPAPGMDFFYVERDGKGNLIINNAYVAYNFTFMEQEFDANIYAMILAYEQRDDVTALQQEVQSKYDEAISGDEKLANMVGATIRNVLAQWRSSVSVTDTQSTENAAEPDTQPAEDTTEPDTQPAEDSEKPDDSSDEPSEQDSESSENDNSESDANQGEQSGNQNSVFTVRTKDICNIRAEASSDSELIGQVSAGAELLAVGTEGNWTKVQFSGGRGYIRSDLLEVL